MRYRCPDECGRLTPAASRPQVSASIPPLAGPRRRSRAARLRRCDFLATWLGFLASTTGCRGDLAGLQRLQEVCVDCAGLLEVTRLLDGLDHRHGGTVVSAGNRHLDEAGRPQRQLQPNHSPAVFTLPQVRRRALRQQGAPRNPAAADASSGLESYGLTELGLNSRASRGRETAVDGGCEACRRAR